MFRLVDRHASRLQGLAIDLDVQTDMGKCTPKEKALIRKTHQTLKRVTNDFESRWHFNTSVALIMELVNALQGAEPLTQDVRPAAVKEALESLVLMLAPMAPHLAEELWEILGHTQETLAHASWPKFVPELAAEDQVEIVVQVNGRVKGRMLVEAGLDKEALAERVLADPKIAQLLDGHRVIKRVAVPDKLVNLVVG